MMNLAAAGLIIGLLGFQGGAMTEEQLIFQALPERIPGWAASGEDMVYDRDTLYDYMDGGAEVYLAFDFQRVYVRKYINSQGEEISLDIFDMGTSTEAYGIFSCDREDETAGIGQESEYGYGLLRFRQGRYFVSVMASDESAEIEKAVLSLGRAALPALGEDGPAPDLLTRLPAENLRRDRISYFHADVNLNNRYFIASENLLRLDRRTECLFAEYLSGKTDPVNLLMIKYSSPNDARDAHSSFIAGYLPEAEEGDPVRMEDGTWSLVRRREALIVVILDAPDEASALGLFAGIRFDPPR